MLTSYFYSFFAFVKKKKKKTRHPWPWSDLHFLLAQEIFRSSFLCSYHFREFKKWISWRSSIKRFERCEFTRPFNLFLFDFRLKLDLCLDSNPARSYVDFSDWFFSLAERERWIWKFCRFQRWSKRWIHLNPLYVCKQCLRIAWLIVMQNDWVLNVFIVDILDPSSGLRSLEFESNELQVKLESWYFN